MTETLLLQVPAAPEYVASIRALTRSACALADLAVDDVEELQIAVDEAATLLLPLVDPSADGALESRFTIGSADLVVTLSVPAPPEVDVDRSGMAWIMLTGLDPAVRVARNGSVLSITIGRVHSDVDQ